MLLCFILFDILSKITVSLSLFGGNYFSLFLIVNLVFIIILYVWLLFLFIFLSFLLILLSLLYLNLLSIIYELNRLDYNLSIFCLDFIFALVFKLLLFLLDLNWFDSIILNISFFILLIFLLLHRLIDLLSCSILVEENLFLLIYFNLQRFRFNLSRLGAYFITLFLLFLCLRKIIYYLLFFSFSLSNCIFFLDFLLDNSFKFNFLLIFFLFWCNLFISFKFILSL